MKQIELVFTGPQCGKCNFKLEISNLEVNFCTPVCVTTRHLCHVSWTFSNLLIQISETFETLALLFCESPLCFPLAQGGKHWFTAEVQKHPSCL